MPWVWDLWDGDFGGRSLDPSRREGTCAWTFRIRAHDSGERAHHSARELLQIALLLSFPCAHYQPAQQLPGRWPKLGKVLRHSSPWTRVTSRDLLSTGRCRGVQGNVAVEWCRCRIAQDDQAERTEAQECTKWAKAWEYMYHALADL